MSQAPRVVDKYIGMAKVPWIEPVELNRYLNELERRLAVQDALIVALTARIVALET